MRRIYGTGASVTMPLKRDARTLGHSDDTVEHVGAANTLVWQRSGWQAFNTDVVGVQQPLTNTLAKRGLVSATTSLRALVLGGGGAAAAAIAALTDLGVHTTVALRDPQKATHLPTTAVVSYAKRHDVPHDILINATPLGGDHSPWDSDIRAKIVFDMSLQPGSRLLADARAADVDTIDGLAMWCAQGAAQMSHMLGQSIDSATVRAHLPEHQNDDE